jgi:DNA end-binding protein Ku
MAARSIASLSISFGLVSVPVKLFPATQNAAGVSFNLLHADCGSRLKQQYVCIREDVVVDRSEMVKGYEFAKDQYVTFSNDELKLLEEKGTQTVDIVAFIPLRSIDPVYFDKAYYLAPDKGGARPYALLAEAMRSMDRCALGKWAWRGKQYMVLIRAAADGIILQQLFYADEVRSILELEIAGGEVKPTELALARQLIEANSEDGYDPTAYTDEVRRRVEQAVEQKVAGKEVTISAEPERGGGQVIDLMEALRASLKRPASASRAAPAAPGKGTATKERKPPRRAAAPTKATATRTKPRKRA